MFYFWKSAALSAVMLFSAAALPAADEAAVRKHMLELANDDRDARKAAVEALTKTGEMRLIPFFKDYADSKIYLWKGQLVYGADDGNAQLLDALAREPLNGNATAAAI